MLLAERQEVIKMKKEISIKEFMTKLNEKGIEHMFFHGGTSELFGVENIKGKKVYLDEGTIWEYKQFPFVMGHFIDLFPLDESDDHSKEHEKLNDDIHAAFWVYRKSISHQTWGEIWKDFVSFNGFEGPIKLVKKLYYAPQKQRFYEQVEKFYQKICSVKGDYYKPYWDVKHIQYPKEWFAEAITVPFEDTEIFVPNGYHEILTYLYNDYMTPPPTHSRSGHHTAYYMNLSSGLLKQLL